MSQKATDTKGYGKQFFSGVAALALSAFIVKLVGLFYKIPMMAYLGAQGMGYFNSAYEIYSLFFVISTTGIPVAISILISENRARARIENIKRIYKISILILGALGFIGTLLLAAFYKELAQLINNDGASLCILAISPSLLSVCLSSAIRGYFQGNQKMAPTAVSQVIEAAGKLLLGLGFAVAALNYGYSITEAAAFAVLGLSIGIILSLAYLALYKLFYKAKEDDGAPDAYVDTNGRIVRELLHIAVPITLSSTILSLTKIIDMTMILSRLADIGYTQSEANALYGSYSTMALPIFNLPSTIVSAIALPLVPLLTLAAERGDGAREKSIISSALKLTSLISFPIGLGITVFSKPILELLFPLQQAEIEYTAPLLSILGMSVFLSSMISVTNSVLQAYKQVKKPIISMCAGIALKIALSFILIGSPSVNIYGAPISTFFSTLVIVSLNMYFILRQSGKINTVFVLFAKPFICAFISVAIGIALYGLAICAFDVRISILITVILVACIYAILILKLKAVTNEEILLLPYGEKILKALIKIRLVK